MSSDKSMEEIELILVNHLENINNNINEKFIQINKRFDEIEEKLNATVEQTAKITEYHSEVTKKLNEVATKQDLEYVDKKLGKHDREIYAMKNRVI